MIVDQGKKNEVNEQSGRKMNGYMGLNRQLFWKEMSNAKGRKEQSCSEKNGRKWEVSFGRKLSIKNWEEFF